MRAGVLAAVFLTAAQSVAADPEPGPAAWLLQVGESARQRSYQGVLVYQDDQDRLETLRVVHRYKNGRVQERITSLSGKQRDVFREDDRVVSVVAEDPQQVHNGPDRLMPPLSAELLEQLAAHYELRDLGTARVAGRATRGVAIAPRDQYRYGHSIWGDVESGVPLRVSLTDADGHVIEQAMFTAIEFSNRIPDGIFALPPESQRVALPVTAETAPTVAEVAGALQVWLMEQLPPGFQVTRRSTPRTDEGGGRVEHILLSDGLSAVSVFSALSKEADSMFHGYSNLGAMNVYGRTIGEWHVTVVGEVPQETVRLIGDGLRSAIASSPATP